MKETIHSMLRRCIGWDYSQPCIYCITVSLADRRSQTLGKVVSDSGAPISARCVLTPLGQAVEACWEAIPHFYPQIHIICKQVMPDHFHGILWVKERLPCHLGQVIKGFKIGCNRAAGILSPSSVPPGKGLFAEGFQDTILFQEGQLAKMIDYVKSNPSRLAVKRANPGLFTGVRDLRVRLSTILSPITGLAAELHFAAIGNRSLLDRPMVQVQCSRRHFGYRRTEKRGEGLKIARDERGEPVAAFSTPEYETLRDGLLAAARHGAVLISPCVSDGERQIAREALHEGVPLVTMQNKGFAKLQKPSGRYFDACAAARLLMLAPAAWPYTPANKPMTRLDATAMNRLCQWLAGEGAAIINYRGVTPAAIDKAALEASGPPQVTT